MIDLDLCFMSATGLARRIANGEVSPVEVVKNALARLDETEPALNAFVFRDDEAALLAARRAEEQVFAGGTLPPLLGVPCSVKDLIDVRGMPCTYGCLPLRDNRPEADAPSVARLRAAGAIILGKTATSEFGLRGYTESRIHGVTRNPWDTSRTPGGSSGGAAASVAAGVTPIALGTDGGGSIRSPCSLTGLVGIKAQFGRVPIFTPSATPTLAHVGPMARCVADAGGLLKVIAGPDVRDWTSLQPSLADSPDRAIESLRVAFSPTLGYARVEAEAATLVAAAVDKLASFWPDIEVVDSILPEAGEILAAEFVAGVAARVAELGLDWSMLDPSTHAAIETFQARSAPWLAERQRARLAHRETLRRFFESYDLLVTPTTPVMAWPIERAVPEGYEGFASWSFFTYPFNLSGQPAASLPCGLSSNRLPMGLQVVVGPQREDLLVLVMATIEKLLAFPATPVNPARM
jgi:Asp-tRNA(Asn)/Glu-tRNA(Gln) amidotransferase A subunit family amidase